MIRRFDRIQSHFLATLRRREPPFFTIKVSQPAKRRRLLALMDDVAEIRMRSTKITETAR